MSNWGMNSISIFDSSTWLLATIIYPLALLLILALRTPAHYSRWWIVSAPLPALLVSIALPDTTLQLPFLLLGAVWQLDAMSRPLLMMTALLWLLAGLFARGYMQAGGLRRFTIFWLATMLGNFTLIVAKDIASFYTGFALMTFAGYGLVVHTLSKQALRAGRIYISMAILGEVLILAGFISLIPNLVEPMLYHVPLAIAEHPQSIWISTLLFAGFGVKVGVLGLHFWLPLAHPVAPTPASAVLSGAMIKAGLIAWMQVLPLGEDITPLIESLNWPLFAWTVIGLGLAASFFAAVLGAFQRKPKAVLAYSSISQMGLMTTLLGVALLMPELWPGVMAALIAFTVHHGLAKGALFLGVGLVDTHLSPAQHSAANPSQHIGNTVGKSANTPPEQAQSSAYSAESPVTYMQHSPDVKRWAVLTLLALPALSLIGLPLTSGAAAKYLLKAEAYATGYSLLMFLLTFATAATTLLMLRFFDLIYTQLRARPSATAITNGVKTAVLLTVIASIVLIWWFPIGLSITQTLTLASLWESLWPMSIAIIAYAYLTTRR